MIWYIESGSNKRDVKKWQTNQSRPVTAKVGIFCRYGLEDKKKCCCLGGEVNGAGGIVNGGWWVDGVDGMDGDGDGAGQRNMGTNWCTKYLI